MPSFEVRVDNGPTDEEFQACEGNLADSEQNVLIFIGESLVPQARSRSSYRVRMTTIWCPDRRTGTWHFTGELTHVPVKHPVTGYFTPGKEGHLHIRRADVSESNGELPEHDLGGGD